jgi:hypothetical protein
VLGVLSFFLSVLAAGPGLLLGVVALYRIGASKGRLVGNSLAFAGIACSAASTAMSMAVFLAAVTGLPWAWRFDAAPIEGDYTIEDLVYAGPEYDESWPLVERLLTVEDSNSTEDTRREVYEIGDSVFEALRDGDLSGAMRILSEHAATIEQAWEAARADRAIIRRLSEFEHINDLTPPTVGFGHAGTERFKHLGVLYPLYATLQASRGDDMGACETLIEMDGMTRKLCVSARDALVKLRGFIVLISDFATAAFIVQLPETSEEVIRLLKGHLTRLSDAETSFANVAIYEYLALKHHVNSFPSGPVLKRNSTLRVLRNECDEIIAREQGRPFEPLCAWPEFYPYRPPVVAREITMNGVYKHYNPAGCVFAAIAASRSDGLRVAESVRVTGELFAIVAAMRLGEEYSLERPGGGDSFVVDAERGIICRRGGEGEFDVALPIDAEILGIR